jgi:stage II sporulation protein AA (anti-sigma F factor antagonist)
MIEIELTAPNRVTLSGRFDASQVEQVSAVFAQLEGDSVIDMEGLRYISSAGISALLILFKRLDAQGYAVRIANAGGHVRNVFEYAGLAQLFPMD